MMKYTLNAVLVTIAEAGPMTSKLNLITSTEATLSIRL